MWQKTENKTSSFCASFRGRQCASRDSTNQNVLFVEWFSRLERAVFGGVHDDIFAIFQACVGNFDTIPPWKVVWTLYLDSSYVSFQYFAFLSVCDKFELFGHTIRLPWWFECYFRRSSWIHCRLLLSVLSDYFGHLVTSTFLLCKCRGLMAFRYGQNYQTVHIYNEIQHIDIEPYKYTLKLHRGYYTVARSYE